MPIRLPQTFYLEQQDFSDFWGTGANFFPLSIYIYVYFIPLFFYPIISIFFLPFWPKEIGKYIKISIFLWGKFWGIGAFSRYYGSFLYQQILVSPLRQDFWTFKNLPQNPTSFFVFLLAFFTCTPLLFLFTFLPFFSFLFFLLFFSF